MQKSIDAQRFFIYEFNVNSLQYCDEGSAAGGAIATLSLANVAMMPQQKCFCGVCATLTIYEDNLCARIRNYLRRRNFL